MFAFEHKVKNLQILFDVQLLSKYYMKSDVWPSKKSKQYLASSCCTFSTNDPEIKEYFTKKYL
jgi:hypothetical protein